MLSVIFAKLRSTTPESGPVASGSATKFDALASVLTPEQLSALPAPFVRHALLTNQSSNPFKLQDEKVLEQIALFQEVFKLVFNYFVDVKENYTGVITSLYYNLLLNDFAKFLASCQQGIFEPISSLIQIIPAHWRGVYPILRERISNEGIYLPSEVLRAVIANSVTRIPDSVTGIPDAKFARELLAEDLFAAFRKYGGVVSVSPSREETFFVGR